MTKEEIVNILVEEASKHDPNEIMCCIAGYREDNHEDYYTWGEYLNALNTQEGYVWERLVKKDIDIFLKNPEIFKF